MSFLDILNEILFWILWYLLLWNAWILLFNKGVPNIKTAPAIRKKIIDIVSQRAAPPGASLHTPTDRPYTIIELGAGNGIFSREIARAMPDARIVSFEISRLAYARCRLARRLTGLNNIEYVRDDFFTHDLSVADAVIFYLTIYEMARLGEKLRAELKPGALVISNRFALKAGWEPERAIDVPTPHPHQKTFYVYTKAPAENP